MRCAGRLLARGGSRADCARRSVESGSLEWLNLLVRNLWVGVLEPKLAKQLSDNLQETFNKASRARSRDGPLTSPPAPPPPQQAAAKKLKYIDKATVHELTFGRALSLSFAPG